jgi:RNAse (barnase) inhibitor barstar
MESVVIDLSEVRTAHALHQLLARQLVFPEYYGNNWDAFDECFGDPDAGRLPGAVRFIGWKVLAERLPVEAERLRECVKSGLADGVRCKVEWAG